MQAASTEFAKPSEIPMEQLIEEVESNQFLEDVKSWMECKEKYNWATPPENPFVTVIKKICPCGVGKRWEKEVGVPTSIESGGGVFSRSEIRKILIEEDEETKQIANIMFEPKDVDYYVTGLMVRTEGKLNY